MKKGTSVPSDTARRLSLDSVPRGLTSTEYTTAGPPCGVTVTVIVVTPPAKSGILGEIEPLPTVCEPGFTTML